MEVIPSYPLNFMAVDIRALKRRSYQLKKNPTLGAKVSKADQAGGDRLLKQAQSAYAQRYLDNDTKISAACNEAGADIHHALRGRVMSFGGLGKGKRLGAGRWRYENGQWIKRD